jgi:hypothetical protein
VQLVAYDTGATEAHVFSLPIDGTFHGELSGTAVADALGTTADACRRSSRITTAPS